MIWRRKETKKDEKVVIKNQPAEEVETGEIKKFVELYEFLLKKIKEGEYSREIYLSIFAKNKKLDNNFSDNRTKIWWIAGWKETSKTGTYCGGDGLIKVELYFKHFTEGFLSTSHYFTDDVQNVQNCRCLKSKNRLSFTRTHFFLRERETELREWLKEAKNLGIIHYEVE